MNHKRSSLLSGSYAALTKAFEPGNARDSTILPAPLGDGCVGTPSYDEEGRAPISYDPESGVFHWVNPPKMARRVRAGDVAGTKNSNGYIVIKIDGAGYKAHRLAWFAVYGDWPAGQIDHINGVRTDNRISNLRDVPHLINAQNRRRANSNNSTGLLGASPSKDGYMATICIDGQKRYLGTFSTAEEAHQAYLQAKRKQHPGVTI